MLNRNYFYFLHVLFAKAEIDVLDFIQTFFLSEVDILRSRTAIKYAIIAGYFDVVEYLLRNGAPVDDTDLKLIKSSGDVKCIELASSRVESECKSFSFPYMRCPWERSFGAESIRNILFQCGLDINYIPLYYAIRRGREDVIEAVLEYGAKLCKPFICKERVWTPLKEALSLPMPMPTIEKLIKHAALQVQSEREVQKLYEHFKVPKAKSFLKFAQRCVDEVIILKSLSLNSSKVTLFSFIVSQGESLKLIQEDSEIIRNVLSILGSTSVPIYMPFIIRKLKKKCILDALCKLSTHLRWGCNSHDITLDYLCIINIINCLCKEDLVNLWIAVCNKR